MIFKRIQKAYQAFKEPEGFEWTGFVQPQNDPPGTTYINPLTQGDGKAEFLGEGTHEEFIDQERADKGEDRWYKRILRKENEQ